MAERIGWVRAGAGERFDRIELSLVSFKTVVTDRRAAIAAELAPGYGLTPAQVLASPDFLIGSVDAIVEQLLERRERFGISHIEVFAPAADACAPVVARPAGR